MANQPKIEVQISAKADQLSASLAKVRKEIAGLPALAQQASRKMGDSGRLSGSMFGLDRIEKQIERMHGAAGAGLGGLGRAGRAIPGFGVLAGAASVAGFGDMMSSAAAAGVQLKNTAYLAGTSAVGLNSMRGAARLMGLSADTADQAMTGLNHTLQDAVFGRNTNAAIAFKQAGVDIGSFASGAKSAESVLPKVVDTLTRMAKVNPLAAERMANIWGIPSGALPMFVRGQDALQAYRKEVERIYGSLEAYLRASEKYTTATGMMSLSTEKLGHSIMTSLAPVLSPMLLDLSKWVDRHNKDISDTFDRIGKSILATDWSGVGKDIEQFGKYLAVAGDRAGIFATNMGRVYNAVTAPGRAFQDWYQGRAPTDSGVDVNMSPEQRTLMYQGGTSQMRAGTLPGPEEGMSLPPAGSGGGSPALPAAEKERRAKAARDQLVGLGWTAQQAAGIVANLYSESGMNEGAVGDGGQAGGLAQWHNDRRQAIMRQFRKPIERMSVEEQVAAVDWELRNPEKAAGDALRQTKTAAEAGDIVSRQYERPGSADAEASVRARSADAFDRRWSGGPRRSPQLTLPDTAPVVANTGSLQITIDHQNVPQGVTMTPKLQSNNAEIAGIRVRRAMPEAGMSPAANGDGTFSRGF